MRVCQFRHFGNGRIRPASKAEHRNREPLVFQKQELMSISTRFAKPNRENKRLQCLRANQYDMEEHKKTFPTPPADEAAVETIPADLAVEARKLVHELSNSLEVIVQTSYLMGTLGLKEPGSDWLRMMDDGVRRAMEINLTLREFIKSHSQK
jgi:hypothetical protein